MLCEVLLRYLYFLSVGCIIDRGDVKQCDYQHASPLLTTDVTHVLYMRNCWRNLISLTISGYSNLFGKI